MPTHAIEEPAYEVTGKFGDVELRQYPPYVVAEVLIPGSATKAGNTAWVLESKSSYMSDPKLKDKDPGAFKLYAVPLP